MHTKLIITIAIVAAILLIPIGTEAATYGCCCDPVVKNGSFDTAANCAGKGWTFVGPPPTLAVTCSQHCKATVTPTPAELCGDGTCQATETATTCPTDCGVVVTGCGSPTYKPKPTLTTKGVKGERAVEIAYDLPCPADYLTVKRCTGTACTDFTTIAETPPAQKFKDETAEFNKDYTYSITAYYSISGESEPATITGNAGDIECWKQGAPKFCISNHYYEQFKDYLITYGYAQYSADTFKSTFTKTVDLTFATRFNQAWSCNDNNKLIESTPSVKCTTGEFCIADENGARCAKKEPCNVNYDPFGFYATKTACETNRYCFFDKSITTPNKCFTCDPKMSCYDYKSKESCETDNCAAGLCKWEPTYDDLGIGVCKDTERQNCRHCDKTGTQGLENEKVFSQIWDKCREEKSDALSTIKNPCFYDKDQKQSKSCDEVTCAHYTKLQCNSPTNGIKLNPDNSLKEESKDACNIKVCQYTDNTGCVKNADGNTGAGFQDCLPGNKACEKDYFPPITTLLPSGKAGRIDYINIRVFDKLNKTSPPINHAGETGYKTYLCIETTPTACMDAQDFGIITTKEKLILKNGELKEGQRKIATLKTGNNKIKYYSRDAANNVEIIKSVDVYACEECNGPTLLNITVTGGNVIGSTIYTSAPKPKFTLEFDEPVTITYAEATKAGESTSLTQLAPGTQTTHEFTTAKELEGTYTLTINGHNDKVIYVDPPGIQYTLIADPTLAGVTITPKDGSVINKTTIDLQLDFTSPVKLDTIKLVKETFENPYAKSEIPKDITTLFKTKDDKTFTAKADKLEGGMYKIVVDAQGFNDLDIYRESTFFLATENPEIRLATPTWGVTARSVFNASVETQLDAECAYVFDTPSAPSSTDYDFFKKFQSKGRIHTTEGLSIPYGSAREYLLHAYCKFKQFGTIQRTFNITLDPEQPIIINAFAEPSTIAEQYTPDKEIYVTKLKTQLNKPGFCKYSLTTSNYPAMNGIFPGLDTIPKESNSAQVNVTEKKSYSYYVTCKGKNELKTKPTRIPFDVDLTLPLNVTSNTPEGFGKTKFTIGVVANKRVFCYVGEQPSAITTCMGACTTGYVQAQEITVQNPGLFTYYVKCAHPQGDQSEILEIPIIIDTTPPEMRYVNDDSSLPEEPQTTWSQNKIRIAMKAEDPESNISHYLITLQGQRDKQIVFKDYISNRTDGKPYYISTTVNGSPFRLTNGKTYNFKVKAINKVGLQSEEMESDGVKLDTSKTPGPCLDGDKNQNESDIDCGGPCEGCQEGQTCITNDDCSTNYCESGKCAIASCEDGTINGLETDVDCGGANCDQCENERLCIIDADCSSDYCGIIQKLCADAPPCADKTLSQGETDIDCGKICDTKCTEGKSCEESQDCAEGLACEPNTKTCTSEPVGDNDEDGIMDDQDQCPGTPYGETVNEQGCGASQTYTLGDSIDDKWRLDHFGCIECPEAALDADPDNDGLNNLEEYNHQTNPTKKDTDGDGWKDGTEIEKGTDPTNPDSKPTSILLGFLKFLLIVAILAATGYYGYQYWQKREKPKPKPKQKAERKEIPTKKDELAALRKFAKKEEIPEEEWMTLEKKIKKKPLPEEKFEKALEKLREIAHKPEPIIRFEKILKGLSTKERAQLIQKIKHKKLTKQELEELLEELKITAAYYKAHEKEFKKELERYEK